MPVNDSQVYNSYNLLIFLNIIKNKNEAGKKNYWDFQKKYVIYFTKRLYNFHKTTI